MSESEEKTEAPSEHKLREARKKGQVAKSADVVAMVSLFFSIIFLTVFWPYYCNKIIGFFNSIQLDAYLAKEHYIIENFTKEAFDIWFLLSIPMLVIAMCGTVAGNLVTFGFLFSTHPLKPEWKKIDPVQGLKKLFSKNRLVELLKQLIKFAIVFLVIFFTIKDSMRNLCLSFRLPLVAAITTATDLLVRMVTKVLICFLAIAVFDFFWQRYSFLKSMRMSKYEVKKEYKQQEGDPVIKQERRRLQQEVMETLSTNSVQDASVVITNPAHLAIALKFDEAIDQAPIVIKKGVGKRARSIIAEATHYSVPILRNVPLARDLQWLEVNEEIPKSLYDSVAEVLTFVEELNAAQEGRLNQ